MLGGHFGLLASVSDDWREMDFGRWQGRRWDAVPRTELDAWAADFLDARPHGGESVAMLLARITAALAVLRRLPGRTLVVTHEGPIRAALVAARGGDAAWHRSVGFGETIVIDV